MATFLSYVEILSLCCYSTLLVRVQDDLTRMLGVLPEDVRGMVRNHPQRKHLLEIVLDLGRAPEARFLGDIGSVFLREAPVTEEELVESRGAGTLY